MLVLCRQENEEIVIGDPERPLAVISVVSIKGDKVRLGVTADRTIPVHRREIADILRGRGKPQCRPTSRSS